VEVLPGASAILAALVASGLPTHAFYFGGFLPRKVGERRRALEALAELDATLVFYESPNRSGVTLAAMAEAFPGRRAAMARELTKLHEEVVRGSIDEVAADVAGREIVRGEVVLLLGPPLPPVRGPVDAADVRERVDAIVADGTNRSTAVKLVAKELGIPRSEVYDIAHRADASGTKPE